MILDNVDCNMEYSEQNVNKLYTVHVD